MILINEWLPNPNGADTKTEFIELFNSGNAAVNLNGWTIKTTGKKIFRFGAQTIAAKGYLVLLRTATKLSLKNTGETVSLYNATGKLVDQSSYLGAAPSGQSFSRVYYPIVVTDEAIPQSFTWGIPTPGAANKANLHNNISASPHPLNRPINATTGAPTFLATLIGVSAILAVLVVYSLKSDENLSKLIFPRDNGVRQ